MSLSYPLATLCCVNKDKKFVACPWDNIFVTVTESQFIVLSYSFSSPTGIHLFKFSNYISKTKCKICSKLTIETPEQRQQHRSGVFVVIFDHIFQRFLLLTLNKQMMDGMEPMKPKHYYQTLNLSTLSGKKSWRKVTSFFTSD